MSNASIERKMRLGWLLDFYGSFLTDRQRYFLDLNNNQDFSLAEIAEQEGISRQGVHDAIRRGETVLHDMEKRLGLVQRFVEMNASLSLLQCEIQSWNTQNQNDEKLKQNWLEHISGLKKAWD